MKKCKSLLWPLFAAVCMTGCMQYAKAEPEEYCLTDENVYEFADGTKVSLWKPEGFDGDNSYRLSEGQEILRVYEMGGPKDSFSGFSGLLGMEEEAQEAVLEYFARQGSLFDLEKLLEDAYEDYRLCLKEEKRFYPHPATEEIEITIETERFTGYVTSVEVPDRVRFEETQTVEEIKRVALFDRSTGEVLSAKELFCVSEEEAVKAIANLAKTEQEMIRLDELIFMQEHVDLMLPPEKERLEAMEALDGGEEGETYAYELVTLTYEELAEYLHPWAIPDAD